MALLRNREFFVANPIVPIQSAVWHPGNTNTLPQRLQFISNLANDGSQRGTALNELCNDQTEITNRFAQAQQVSKECDDAAEALAVANKEFYKLKHEFMIAQDAVRWAEQLLRNGDHSRYREVIDQLGKWTSKRHSGISADVNTVGFCFMLQPVKDSGEQKFAGVTGPMQNVVGIDTDSAVSASNRRSDFVDIDSESSHYGNSSVSGVGGGSSKIGGLGAMIVAVKITLRDGSRKAGYLCVPNACYLLKKQKTESDVRIFSTTMLNHMGVIYRQE